MFNSGRKKKAAPFFGVDSCNELPVYLGQDYDAVGKLVSGFESGLAMIDFVCAAIFPVVYRVQINILSVNSTQ